MPSRAPGIPTLQYDPPRPCVQPAVQSDLGPGRKLAADLANGFDSGVGDEPQNNPEFAP